MRVCLAMQYERVIVAGVPLDRSGHFFDPPPDMGGCDEDYAVFASAWHESVDDFAGRVKSMSGVTREILGAPA